MASATRLLFTSNTSQPYVWQGGLADISIYGIEGNSGVITLEEKVNGNWISVLKDEATALSFAIDGSLGVRLARTVGPDDDTASTTKQGRVTLASQTSPASNTVEVWIQSIE